MIVLIYLLLTLREECYADNSITDTTTIHVGDHVAMTCSRRSSGNIFWMRIVFGNSPEYFECSSHQNPPHIKVERKPGNLELRIIKAKLNDSGVYLCLRQYQENNIVLKVTHLRVEELLVTRTPPSVLLHPKDSVTLQCSVLRDFHNRSCPVDDSLHCFRAKFNLTNPRFNYAQIDEDDENKNNSEGFTAKKCFYSYLKNLSFSEVQMYYCGLAVQNEEMPGKKSKHNNEDFRSDRNNCVSTNDNKIIILLCTALAICMVVIVFLIYTIKNITKKSKESSTDAVALQTHASLRGNQENQQTDEDSLIYSGIISTSRKSCKKVANGTTSEEQETIYTEVNFQR